MAASVQVAAIRENWPTALTVLKGIPAAVADKSLPLEDLLKKAWHAEATSRDASCEMYQTLVLSALHDHEVAGLQDFTPESRKVLVDEFKVGKSDCEFLPRKSLRSATQWGPHHALTNV